MTDAKTPNRDRAAEFEAFRAFDGAVRADMGKPAPSTEDASRSRLASLIEDLPQREVIDTGDAERWLRRTMEMAKGRMELEHGEGGGTVSRVHDHVLWHIRRASGIGGSETSTVVKHYRGERGTYGDAHNLVREKLLQLSPQPSNEAMSRGVRGEPWVRRMFHEKTGAVTDHAALERLRDFRWEDRPFIIGTPDDIVVMPDGKRRMPDYKVPSAEVMADYERNGIAFDYICQDHHYMVVAHKANVRINELTIEAFDPASFQVKSFEVPIDVELVKEIVLANDRLWNENVMTGIVPAAPARDELAVEDEALVAIGVQAAMLKVLSDQLMKRHNELRDSISTMASVWHESATGKMDLKVGSFTRDRQWDEAVLRDLALRAEVDVSQFETDDKKIDAKHAGSFLADLHAALVAGDDPAELLEAFREDGVVMERKLDTNALAEHLEANGVSLSEATGVREAFRISTKKKGPEFDRLMELRGEVAEIADFIDNTFRDAVPRIVSGERKPDDITEADMAM